MRVALLVIFVLSYIGILSRRLRLLPVGRPAVAMIGAAASAALSAWNGPPFLTFDQSLHAIELHTLVLLFSMMVLAAGLGEAGFFSWATSALTKRIHSRVALLWAVTLSSGLLSAVLVNDAVCLLATPLVVHLARAAKAKVTPFLFAVAMGSNAGSAMTLSGNPQNMLVAKLSSLGYADYLLRCGPAAFMALLTTALVLSLLFSASLADESSSNAAADQVTDRPLLYTALAMSAATVAANLLGVPLALSALCAASVVLLASRARAQALLRQVDWSVLLFFAGLFVLVANFERTEMPSALLAHVDAAVPHSQATLTAVLMLGSQVVSNVPLILLLEPWIRSFDDVDQAFRMTALMSSLAGNLTLLGSVANIIVFEQAEHQMGFWSYLKVGVLVTVSSGLVAWAVVWLASQ
jgi:Na+/H+ antiporter NhaD/arsenite permease-like protein